MIKKVYCLATPKYFYSAIINLTQQQLSNSSLLYLISKVILPKLKYKYLTFINKTIKEIDKNFINPGNYVFPKAKLCYVMDTAKRTNSLVTKRKVI